MHKPYPNILIIIFFMIVTIVTSCGENLYSSKFQSVEFNEDEETVKIINEMLPILIPDSVELIPFSKQKENIDSLGMLLYVDNLLGIPDSSDVEWMIKKGGNQILNKFSSDSIPKKNFDVSKIKNYGRVKITDLTPNTSEEMDRFYGNISFSRMIFTDNYSKVYFVYYTSRFRDCMSSETNVVEAKKTNRNWIIVYNSRDMNAD